MGDTIVSRNPRGPETRRCYTGQPAVVYFAKPVWSSSGGQGRPGEADMGRGRSTARGRGRSGERWGGEERRNTFGAHTSQWRGYSTAGARKWTPARVWTDSRALSGFPVPVDGMHAQQNASRRPHSEAETGWDGFGWQPPASKQRFYQRNCFGGHRPQRKNEWFGGDWVGEAGNTPRRLGDNRKGFQEPWGLPGAEKAAIATKPPRKDRSWTKHEPRCCSKQEGVRNASVDWTSVPCLVVQKIVDASRSDTVAKLRLVSKTWKYLVDRCVDDLVVVSTVKDLSRVRKTFPLLRSVQMRFISLGPSDLSRNLLPLHCMHTLALSNCRNVDSRGLESLADIAKGTLTSLNLSGADTILDETLAKLTPLSKLKNLGLDNLDKITDAGMNSVALAFTDLDTLSLACCPQITDESLSHLANAAKLRALDISGNPAVTLEGMIAFNQHKCLMSLKAASCMGITTKGMVSLAMVAPLDAIELTFDRGMQDGLHVFGELRGDEGIKELHINVETSLYLEDAMEGLSGIRYVEKFVLSGMCVRSSCFRRLNSWGALRQIKSLQLEPVYNGLQGRDLMKLPNCGHLEVLRLDRCGAVDTAFLNKLSNRVKGLKSLSIPLCHDVEDRGIMQLCWLPNLEELDISECIKVTDEGVRSLRKLPKLKRLHISRIPITDHGLFGLRFSPKLEYLDVSRCDKITSEGINSLALVPSMEHIKACYCAKLPRVDDVAVNFYKRAINTKAVLEREHWLPADFRIPGEFIKPGLQNDFSVW